MSIPKLNKFGSRAAKLAKIRLFSEDESRRWEKNVMEMGGSVLCVSQFTLCANLKKGAKPDFHDAMPGEDSKKIFDHFCATLRKLMGDPERVKGQFLTFFKRNIVIGIFRGAFWNKNAR